MHTWKFFKSARCVQAKIETGDDVAALAELDPKLWTVLSAPLAGLRFDAPTLALLDSDHDGRIRVKEVLGAVDWLRARFKNLDFLFARRDTLPLDALDASSEAGGALLSSFKNVLARAGKPDAAEVSLADVTGTTDVFNAQPLNGDGVITPLSTSDAALSETIRQIIACEGAVKDRSGADGADAAKVAAFFADAAAYLAWTRAGEPVAVLGAETAAAYAAYAAVAPTVDAYFTPAEELPLVAADPTPSLPLLEGVNPRWQDALRTFATAAAAPLLGRAEAPSITRAEWQTVKDKFAPYAAWLAAKAGDAVASVGAEKLAALVQDGRAEAALNELFKKDLAFADEYARLVDCERALRYAAHLVDWLENDVNQAALYDPAKTSVFHTGVLYLDGRACHLCFHVADEAAHAALAEKSKCCLVYAKLTRAGEAPRAVCAVITAGTTATLYPGRNGLFYDADGRDWEATVTKVVAAQVSLREAFWAPWAKIATTLSEQCKKFLAAKQDAAVAQVGAGVGNAASAPQPGANAAALASSVAALGVGVGMAGAACAGLVGLVAGLPFWKVVAGVAAIILVVSLPSVILAYFKLRVRDLGALLNAGGWAVNRPLYFSIGLARTFTRPAQMPLGAAVARDPYARGTWWKALLLLAVLAALAAGACWKLGVRPFGAAPAQTAEGAAS